MSNSKQMLEALSKGDLVGAQVAFESSKEDLPEEIFQLADNLFQLGFMEEAQTLYEKLFTEFPEEETLKISLAEIAIENDELDKAFEYLESIEESSDLYAQSLITQADIYQVLNIPEVSESKLKQAKKSYQMSHYLIYLLLNFTFQQKTIQKLLKLIWSYKMLLKRMKHQLV